MNKKIDSFLKKAPIEYRGHHRRGTATLIDEFVRACIYAGLARDNEHNLQAAILAKTPLEKPVRVSFGHDCMECGERIDLWTNGVSVGYVSECQFPDGQPSLVLRINVPSGKLAIGNDFRKLFPVEEKGSARHIPGMMQISLSYVPKGMAHCFVGNTNPRVYQEQPDRFLMVYEEMAGLQQVAHIGTDLWWYSICDHDEYLRRLSSTGQEMLREVDIVSCTPGEYEIRHQFFTLKNYEEPGCIYAIISRVA